MEFDRHDPALTTHVSESRWRRAQEWELSLWRDESRTSLKGRFRAALARIGLASILIEPRGPLHGDDWNEWWAHHFDSYRFLPPTFDRVIELGCGPYTNIRLMMVGRHFDRVYCSDPLAREYARMRGTWLAEAYRRQLIFLDDHPAEESPFAPGTFDLTVMINVLDHVRDLHACLRTATLLTKVGGWLVLGQDLTDPEDARRIGDDAGHPIRVDEKTLDDHLLTAFAPILRSTLPREQGRNPDAHYGTFLFAGQRL